MFYIGWLGTSIDIEATTDTVHGGFSFARYLHCEF